MPAFNYFLPVRPNTRYVDDEGYGEATQFEVLVEPVGNPSEIGLGAFVEHWRLEGCTKRGLEIAQLRCCPTLNRIDHAS